LNKPAKRGKLIPISIVGNANKTEQVKVLTNKLPEGSILKKRVSKYGTDKLNNIA
jgi:hypothetical protein